MRSIGYIVVEDSYTSMTYREFTRTKIGKVVVVRTGSMIDENRPGDVNGEFTA